MSERDRQHVYLELWENEGVESMLLAMELFLLVRDTHPALRMEMEDIHTRKQRRTHVRTTTPMETLRVSSNTQTSGGFTGDGSEEITILDYLLIVDFSQGLLKVSEKENVKKIMSHCIRFT